MNINEYVMTDYLLFVRHFYLFLQLQICKIPTKINKSTSTLVRLCSIKCVPVYVIISSVKVTHG